MFSSSRRTYPGDGWLGDCAAPLRLTIRRCRKRAAIVAVARMPHKSPPTISAINWMSRRSSGVLVSIPINVTRPIPKSIRANVVSTQLIRGRANDRRAADRASTLLPNSHQKNIPANGQLRGRQTSGDIPLGTHSLFVGLTSGLSQSNHY